MNMIASFLLSFIIVCVVSFLLLLWFLNRSAKNILIDSKNDIRKNPGFITKVVGVTYKNEDGASRQMILRDCFEGDKLTLVRQPDNPKDSDAIAIFTKFGEQIGFIPSDAQLASYMDSGKMTDAYILRMTGGSGQKIGCVIRIEKLGKKFNQ